MDSFCRRSHAIVCSIIEQRLPQQLRFGDYVLNVTYERPSNQTPNVLSGGLVVAIGMDEFIFAGTGLTVTCETDKPGNSLVGILSAEEGKFENGQWRSVRRLNGDQT